MYLCACASVCLCFCVHKCVCACVCVCVCVCVFVCDLTSETSTQRPHLSHPTSPANAVVRKTSLLLLFLWRLEQLWSLTGLSLSKHFDRFYIISFTFLISLVMNNISQTIRNIICMWMTSLKIFEILCVWYLVHLGLRDSKQSVSGIRWILWKATTCACPHQETCFHFTFSRYSRLWFESSLTGLKNAKKGPNPIAFVMPTYVVITMPFLLLFLKLWQREFTNHSLKGSLCPPIRTIYFYFF